ncbi:MAG: SAM-dependent methyltransferase [Thermobacillus sp. ZCTH02-B1]|uniref:class I SAM-dependent methyltransferase n=1 Tax=Thermobacillus sp. ZCTH02-B1 TaxID=1858795 RepID=UPI000B583ECD|nr:class I SAM-dependent methyltransferase [Thermobacillus sp. ZCTH02-B1]OUM96702.1 MAG: SAM-dependent methyltransferase [Thermobacillus sp. ZCTH02-B1]
MIVTTGMKPTEEETALAKALAAELGGRFVPRNRQTLSAIRRRHQDDRVLVTGPDGLRLHADDGGLPLRYHPGMGLVRARRLRDGGTDPLVEISGARPGDSVLDCTAGLAGDAFVFAWTVGPSGRVVALESEAVLYVIVREGLRTYDTGLADLNAALRRIELIRTDHLDYLRSLPDDSFDIVYFDPMFRIPVLESSSMLPLRGIANPAPLSPEAVREAMRVARRTVMMKENRESGEFERLGFTRVTAKNPSAVAYGVIHVERP